MKIGILGGTFDPIHLGHLKIARTALRELKLDKIVFIPCSTPPHKPINAITPAEHRLKMVRLAIEGHRNYELSDYEISRGGTSFSAETLSDFKESHPDDEIYFIIGSDSYLELSTWKDNSRIPKLSTIAVVRRPSYDYKGLAMGVVEIKMPPVNISSSRIRSALKQGGVITDFVPAKVASYISKHKLYA